MKVIQTNRLKEIERIVLEKAKYQKVMVLFDETISNEEIIKVYEVVKEFCVYNKCEISKINKEEIFNGYRLIIYLCSANSFLNLNFNNEEFVNIFCPTGDELLTFFLSNESTLKQNNNYLLIEKQSLDMTMLTSVYFNSFYCYLKNMLYGQKNKSLYEISFDLNPENAISKLLEVEAGYKFVDVDFVKKNQLDLKEIVLVDLLLIDAFLLWISGVKNQNNIIVDLFKDREKIDVIDKFYKLFLDHTFINMLVLNQNFLYNFCLKIKNKIMEILKLTAVDLGGVEKIIYKLKNYAKEDADVLAYLYLFRLFEI